MGYKQAKLDTSGRLFIAASLAQKVEGSIIGLDTGQKVAFVSGMRPDSGLPPDDPLAPRRKPGTRGREFPADNGVLAGRLTHRFQHQAKKRMGRIAGDPVL